VKIAIINPLERPVTPTTSGGGEVFTANLTLELAKRGHYIDLLAASGSLDKPPYIRLKEVIDRGTDERISDDFFRESKDFDRLLMKFTSTFAAKELLMLKESENEYDLVIDSSTNFLVSLNWPFFNIPLVVLGHLPINLTYTHIFDYMDLPQNIYFIFPSKYQFDRAVKISGDRKFLIPHGIDIKNIGELHATGKNNIVWLGRISRKNNKGLKEAIITSQKSGKKLSVFGYIEDEEYFNEMKSLDISNSVEFTQGETDKLKIFQNAKLLLFPSGWEEPFGLVNLEAMATGTPVVAYARGAAPEIIKDGETGFLVNPSDHDIRGDFIIKKTGTEGLHEAVERIYSMPEDEYLQMRKNARNRVEQNYTVEKMVDQYEAIFSDLTGK
jgi:glycosyltransferase involved in cell wall biosynthesis